jgi:hypothetical protein
MKSSITPLKLSPLILSTFIPLVASCGTSSSGGGGAPAPAESKNTNYTMVVDTIADLPACGATNPKQLVYVTSESTFKSCESGTWTAISIAGKDGAAGAPGADGLSITSNQILSPYNTNICTMYSSLESCYFNGGQIVKYSDGTVLITGSYSYDLFVSSASNGGYAEYDRLANSITMLVPPTVTAGFQRLDWWVSRGTVAFKRLFLVYDRTTDGVSIIFDTNGSGTVNTGDETVHTVVKTSW